MKKQHLFVALRDAAGKERNSDDCMESWKAIALIVALIGLSTALRIVELSAYWERLPTLTRAPETNPSSKPSPKPSGPRWKVSEPSYGPCAKICDDNCEGICETSPLSIGEKCCYLAKPEICGVTGWGYEGKEKNCPKDMSSQMVAIFETVNERTDAMGPVYMCGDYSVTSPSLPGCFLKVNTGFTPIPH